MRKATKVWIEFVNRDIKAAYKLLEDEYLSNIVILHSQQAIEKILKAILEEKSIKIPKTHSVFSLYNLIPEEIKDQIKINIDELEIIDDIYIDSRYPTSIGSLPNGFPEKKDSEIIYNIAKSIVDKCLKILDTNIKQKNTEK